MKHLNFLIQPSAYFANTHTPRAGFLIVGIVIGVMTLLVLISEFLPRVESSATDGSANSEQFEEIRNSADFDLPPTAGASRWYVKPLFFPILWMIFLAYCSGARLLFATILGETKAAGRGLLASGSVSVLAAVPIVIAGGLLSAYTTIVPHGSLAGGDVADLAARLSLSFGALFLAFLWEGLIAVAGYRAVLEQNRGRAVLMWLVPYFGCVGIAILLNLFT